MGFAISVFRAQLDNLIAADDEELAQLARDRQIKSAVEKYSDDAPEEHIDDVTGDGGRYYPLTGVSPVLGSWVEGSSRILQIEYPAAAVASDETPIYLDPEDWRDDYWAGDVRYLYLPRHTPAATEEMRVRYTIPYAWVASDTVVTEVSLTGYSFSDDDYIYLEDGTWKKADDQRIATHVVDDKGASTFNADMLEVDVPGGDFFAICHLAASLCCRALAAKYAKISDSTISADSTAHATKSGEFARRADEFLALYNQHMGLGPRAEAEQVHGAGEFVDWNTAPGWPAGRRWIFHGGR